MAEVGGRRIEQEGEVVSELEKHCEPCQRRSTTTMAAGLCRECEEYMCQTCFDNHLTAKVCMDHILVDDLKSSVTGKGMIEDVGRCKQHDNEIVKYYCRKHETVGCGDCMLSGGHNACKPENIKHLAKNFKDEKVFQDLVSQVKDIETDKKLTESFHRDNMRKNRELSEKVVNEVRKFRKYVDNFLNKAETNILCKIKTVTSENNEKMTMLEKSVESLSTELEEIRQKLDAEHHNGNVLFINAVGCKPELKRIAQSLAYAKSKQVLKNVAFYPDEDLHKIAASAKPLGSIHISSEENVNRIVRPRKDENSRTSSAGSVEIEKNDGAETDNVQTEKYCVICMEKMANQITLKCGHIFCSDCIDTYEIKKACPGCRTVCGIITGDQPEGKMIVSYSKQKDCAGYGGCGLIIITYTFPDGRQGSNHPNPGRYYKGITRSAYLPNNKDGRMILEMLKVAFERKLVFTIGYSKTTGQEGVITWNKIHHKTNPSPNSQFGYPDPTYLSRVKEELEVKGVTEDDIPKTDAVVYGYPDPTYLSRVKEELAAMGVTEDDIPKTESVV